VVAAIAARPGDCKPHRRNYLAGGEQQMLAIGRELMARPKMILMDESMGCRRWW
jgi:ABC-type branched-subunit amino acid transport system ATPase component